MTLVTIFSDASYCSNTRVGGWGCYIAVNGQRVNRGGAFANRVRNNVIAEHMALVNAIWTGRSLGLVNPGDKIILQTDSMETIRFFAWDRERVVESACEQSLAVWDKFTTMVFGLNLETEFRWVRGHDNGKTTRSYANEVCDRLAKSHMRRVRARVWRNDARKRRKAGKRKVNGNDANGSPSTVV